MSKRNMLVVAALVVACVVALLVVRDRRTDGSTPESQESAEVLGTTPPAAHSAATAAKLVSVRGTVVSADQGVPIQGAVVHLAGTVGHELPPDALTVRSDADGGWRIADVPPGQYSLSVTAVGYLPATIDALDATRSVADVALALQPGGNSLSGVVSDISGGPVAGAVVQVAPVHGLLSVRADRRFAALTDGAGRYALQVADGRYRAVARHSDYVSQAQDVELRGGARVLDFSLAPGGLVEGVVLAKGDDTPVPGALVTYSADRLVQMSGGEMMAIGGRTGLVVSDQSGAFRIRGLQAGVVRLDARAPGGATHASTTVALGIGEQVSGVQLYLATAYRITGRVVVKGAPPQPAAGVQVTALAPREGRGYGAVAPTTDAGEFVVDGVLPGRYRIEVVGGSVVGPGLGQGVVVAVDDKDVTGVVVEVAQGVSITGRVEPPGIAEISFRLGGDDGLPGLGSVQMISLTGSSTRSAPDGSFELGPVLPGEVTLVGRAADGSRGEAAVVVTEQGAAGVVIQLEGKASVSGRVVNKAGAPVADATVSLRRAQGNRHVSVVVNGRDLSSDQAPTHEDGSFLIRGLEAGEYQLQVLDAQRQPLAWADAASTAEPAAPKVLTLTEDQDKSGLELRVENRDGVIRGVVYGPAEEPLADAWVTATPTPEPVVGRSPGGAAGGPPRRRPQPAHEGVGDNPETVQESHMVMVVADDGGDDDTGAGPGLSGSVPPVLTDSSGRFEITGLRDGAYDLMGEGLRGGARGFIRGVKSGTDVRLDLVNLTRIDGQVTLNGEPAEQFSVELRGASMRSKQVRDADGRFTIHRLDPGQYTVEVITGEATGSAPVTVVAGKPTTVTIALQRSVRVIGSVTTPTGEPVVGKLVLLGKRSGDDVQVAMVAGEEPPTTDTAGQFQVMAGPGQYMLLVIDPAMSGGPLVQKPFDVLDADVDLGKLVTAAAPH